jgi:hypothetical protein
MADSLSILLLNCGDSADSKLLNTLLTKHKPVYNYG